MNVAASMDVVNMGGEFSFPPLPLLPPSPPLPPVGPLPLPAATCACTLLHSFTPDLSTLSAPFLCTTCFLHLLLPAFTLILCACLPTPASFPFCLPLPLSASPTPLCTSLHLLLPALPSPIMPTTILSHFASLFSLCLHGSSAACFLFASPFSPRIFCLFLFLACPAPHRFTSAPTTACLSLMKSELGAQNKKEELAELA